LWLVLKTAGFLSVTFCPSPPAKVVSLSIGNLEGTMGDTDENIVEKLVDTINDVVETVTTTAADALSDSMEPDHAPEGDNAKRNREGCEKDRQGK